jgi:hypothetical protein
LPGRARAREGGAEGQRRRSIDRSLARSIVERSLVGSADVGSSERPTARAFGRARRRRPRPAVAVAFADDGRRRNERSDDDATRRTIDRSAHIRTALPRVWSSFCTTNVPAFATFVSRVNVSFRTPSGRTNFSARDGWFMVAARATRGRVCNFF